MPKQPKQLYLSLYLSTFSEHYIQGYLLYNLMDIANILYPQLNPLETSLWLYCSYSISYIAKPIGIMFFKRLFQITQNLALKINLIIYISCIFIIMNIPYLKPSISIFSILLFVFRFISNMCQSGENILARSIISQLAHEKDRKDKISNYDNAILLGNMLALLTSLYIGWHQAFIITITLSLCSLYYRIYDYQEIKIHDNSSQPSIYTLAVISTGYISYSLVTNYSHQLSSLINESSQHTITSIMLLINIITVYLIKKIALHTDHLIKISGIILYISSVAIIFCSHSSLWEITFFRTLINISGAFFNILLLSKINNMFPKSLKYNALGLQYVIASVCYGKLMPMLLIFNEKNHFLIKILLSIIILAPISIALYLTKTALFSIHANFYSKQNAPQ